MTSTHASTITEPQRQLPIINHVDVAVVGGGIAGVSAALAAARQGVKVVLMEKESGLGGLATLGNVIKYLPICDGHGRQVIGGIGEELLHLSVAGVRENEPKWGIFKAPDCWDKEGNVDERGRKRFLTSFNPATFQIEMEYLLEKEGVEIMYDTRLCQAMRNDEGITHLIVENKSGRLALEVGAVVDASGDADVCHHAGVVTQNFPNNVLAGWHYLMRNGQMKVVQHSRKYDKDHGRGNGAQGPFFNGVDHHDVSQHILQTRRWMREKIHELKVESPEDNIHPFQMASIADVRVTRCLKNKFLLKEEHMHQWFDDCIGLTGDWRRRGPVYPIPLRSIVADGCPNLWVAGRCMSSDASVVDVTRAIPTCAVTGEASGVAAGMRVKSQSHAGVSLSQLQRELIAKGVLMDRSLVAPAPAVSRQVVAV